MKTKSYAFERDGIIGSFLTGFEPARLEELATIWISKGVQDLKLVELDVFSYVDNQGNLIIDSNNKKIVKVYRGN